MYSLDVTIQGTPKLLLNSRGHWRTIHAEKKRWRLKTIAAIRKDQLPPKPLTAARITLTRFTSQESDFDNRVSSYKAVVDALVEIGVIASDKDSVLKERHYPWEKVANRYSRIRIQVEEL